MSVNNRLKISFVVPFYNEEERIARCLESILSQKCEKEIICVNDASTDNSPKIVEKYKNENSEVKLINNEENCGLGHARNVGIMHANGDYIWFIDADDYIEKNATVNMMDLLEKNELDILCFDMRRITETDDSPIYQFKHSIAEAMSGRDLYVLLSADKSMRASACVQLYSINYLRDNNIWFQEKIIGEDIGFSMKSLILSNKTMYIREAYYVYEKSTSSITTTKSIVKRFTGYFSAYAYINKFYMERTGDEELCRCMAPVIANYYSIACENFLGEYEKEMDEWFEKNASEHTRKQYYLFKNIALSGQFIRKISGSLVEAINKSSNIIIYGAGNVAKEFAYMMEAKEEIRKPIISYAVSERNNVPCSIYGVPVKIIDELVSYNKNSLVVIATMPRSYESIIKRLQGLGFDNYVCIL